MGYPLEVSKKEQIVLDIFAKARLKENKDELYKDEIIERSNGALSSHGIYVLLGRMEEKDLIAGRDEDKPKSEDFPRRVYRITENGHQARTQKEEKSEVLPDEFCPA